MEFRALCTKDQTALHRTFLRAFSDYSVPMNLDAAAFERLVTRRGAAPAFSVGVYDEDEMVAMMVTGVGEYEGRPTAYDVFTGVVPSHRGRGLAGRMFDFARPALEAEGYERFVLEVISTNEAARRAYERVGFVVRRQFRCFHVDCESVRRCEAPAGVDVEVIDRPRWDRWDGLTSWSPSWQNTRASIERAIEPVLAAQALVDGEVVGHAILLPVGRDLPQLAVAPRWRRRGIGSALVGALLRRAPSVTTLRAINVDANSAADVAFYTRWSGEPLPTQFEMELDFTRTTTGSPG